MLLSVRCIWAPPPAQRVSFSTVTLIPFASSKISQTHSGISLTSGTGRQPGSQRARSIRGRLFPWDSLGFPDVHQFPRARQQETHEHGRLKRLSAVWFPAILRGSEGFFPEDIVRFPAGGLRTGQMLTPAAMVPLGPPIHRARYPTLVLNYCGTSTAAAHQARSKHRQITSGTN